MQVLRMEITGTIKLFFETDSIFFLHNHSHKHSLPPPLSVSAETNTVLSVQPRTATWTVRESVAAAGRTVSMNQEVTETSDLDELKEGANVSLLDGEILTSSPSMD